MLGMDGGNRLERLLAMLAGGCVFEHLEGFDQAAADRRLEERSRFVPNSRKM